MRGPALRAADVVLLTVGAAGRAPRVARAAAGRREREALLRPRGAADWHGLRLEVGQNVSTNWCRFLHDVLPDLSQSVQYQSQSGLHVQQRSVTNKSEAEMQHAVRQLVTKYGVDPAALASWRCMVTPQTESRKNRVKNYFSPNGVRCRSVVEI